MLGGASHISAHNLCLQVGTDDAEKIGELSLAIAREERALAELRGQTAGLEKQAAALQAKIDAAGACVAIRSCNVCTSVCTSVVGGA